AIAVMAVISLAFFYPDSIEGNTLQQHDVQQGIANGEEARAFHEATGETTRWTNSLFGGMPTFQIAPSYPSNSLFEWIGKAYSLWLPSTSGLMMMMMMGMYWLLIALRRRWYYALIGAIAWGLSSYFVIIIGAGHIWKFITLAYVPPTLAGVILAYRRHWLAGGALTGLALMMQIAANHIQMTYYFGFMIVILAVAYLVNALRRKEVAGWLKGSASLVVAAALAVAANAPSLYNTYRYTAETIRGGHSELTDPHASAAATDGGLDRDYITQYSYGRSETFSLLIPDVKGGASAKPVAGRMQMKSLTDLDGAQEAIAKSGLQPHEQQYISQFTSQYFGEPEGTNGPVYVGAIICALFILGLVVVRGPMKWAMLAATILSIALAWGRNFMSLTDLFIDIVPMYNKFRTPESILVVAQLAMPLLGIMALQKVLTAPEGDRRANLKAVVWSFGGVAFICLLGWLFPGVFGSAISQGDRDIAVMISQSLQQQGYDADVINSYSIANPRIAAVVTELRHSMVSADSGRSLLLILLAGSAIMWGIAMGRDKIAAAAVGVLVLFDLYNVDKRYVSHDSFTEPAPATERVAMTQADRVILEDHGYYRVMPMGALFQSADPSYYHKSLGGYHAAKLTRYQDLLERHLLPAASGAIDETNLNIISMLNGKYIIDPQGRVIPNEAAMGNAWLVDTLTVVDGADAEMAALDLIDPATTAVTDSRFTDILGTSAPATAPGDTIMLTNYAPNELTYRFNTAGGALAVFSEVYFPWGWRATIDGGDTELPIGRVDYVLRAIRLPEGEHTLTMTFDPRSLHVTGNIATVAIILIYLWVIAALVAEARRKEWL
ncbi:MAG: YfhO family protein, partial [Muribaculaceae bacterium]|nr:YfhO family protein [Muribaculaceae bacterium]